MVSLRRLWPRFGAGVLAAPPCAGSRGRGGQKEETLPPSPTPGGGRRMQGGLSDTPLFRTSPGHGAGQAPWPHRSIWVPPPWRQPDTWVSQEHVVMPGPLGPVGE